MAEENEAPSLFELLGPPISTDQGTIYDYGVSSGEMLGAGFGRQLDTNVGTSFIARPLSFLGEDLMAIAGASEWVGAERARKEIQESGLELTVPDNGVSRYELDTLKYLKKREAEQNQIMARNQTMVGAAAGFAGGLAAGLTDPINIASAFIPIVPQARYAAWVAEASGVVGRAGVRAGVGLAEGAVGAAIVEPFAYAGAQMSQLEYTAADSFINIVFGGVLGGGLHSAGGLGFDYFNAGQIAAAKEVGNWLPYLSSREAAANAPDDVKMGALHSSVRALEDDLPVRADEHFEAWHGSPHKFDKFQIEAIGTGEGVQAYGPGFYFAESQKVARYYQEHLSSSVIDIPGAKSSSALAKEFLDTASGDQAAALAALQTEAQRRWKGVKKRLGEIGYESQKRFAEAEELIKGGSIGGHMYEVRIKGKPEDYVEYTGPKGDEAIAFAEAAKAAGARGIRYLDAESRDIGAGTSNYVVFNPDDITVVSRNGEPVAKPKAPKKDAFEAEDMETSALADKAVSAPEFSIDDVNASYELAAAHIDSMRERGLVTREMEDMIRAGDEAAARREAEAAVYEAALVCDMEG